MNKVLLAGGAFVALATSTLAIAAQTMAGGAPATAGSTPSRQPPHEVTFAEFKADADKLWDRLDVNHDGRIDQADRDARMLERFAMWDTNHDGVISKDEFLAHAHAREAAWKGHDHHGPEAHGPEAHGQGGPGHDGPPPPDAPDHRMDPHGPDGMGHPHGHMMAMAIMWPAMHDARKDGAITRPAFDAAIKARFDTIDTNHDGKLSHEEMRAARPDHDHGHHGDWHKGGDRHGGHGDMPPPPPTPAGQ